jgi:hypothetical protein
MRLNKLINKTFFRHVTRFLIIIGVSFAIVIVVRVVTGT